MCLLEKKRPAAGFIHTWSPGNFLGEMGFNFKAKLLTPKKKGTFFLGKCQVGQQKAKSDFVTFCSLCFSRNCEKGETPIAGFSMTGNWMGLFRVLWPPQNRCIECRKKVQIASTASDPLDFTKEKEQFGPFSFEDVFGNTSELLRCVNVDFEASARGYPIDSV